MFSDLKIKECFFNEIFNIKMTSMENQIDVVPDFIGNIASYSTLIDHSRMERLVLQAFVPKYSSSYFFARTIN